MPEVRPLLLPERCPTSKVPGPREKALTGQAFGRWLVLDRFEKTKKGEKKWLCRCSCGTERYVLERALKSGGSQSCGCLRREEAAKAKAHDLTGMVFGELTVLCKAKYQRKNGGIWWHCRCSCGEGYEVPGSLLVTGRRTRCGSSKHEKNYSYGDIAGKRFGRLVAQYRKPEKGGNGAVWRCRCDCGGEIDVSYNCLVHGGQSSCGCKRKEHEQKLGTFLTHMGGTSLEMLKSTKVPSNNTTGVRGVYLIKGKYVAKVVFQKKPYYLGSYSTIEEAVEARKEGEEALFGATVEYHEKWKAKAAADPAWGEANPVRITVERERGRVKARFWPELE